MPRTLESPLKSMRPSVNTVRLNAWQVPSQGPRRSVSSAPGGGGSGSKAPNREPRNINESMGSIVMCARPPFEPCLPPDVGQLLDALMRKPEDLARIPGAQTQPLRENLYGLQCRGLGASGFLVRLDSRLTVARQGSSRLRGKHHVIDERG